MERVTKNYVCGAHKCRFNDGCGGCERKEDELLIGKNGICKHFGRNGDILVNSILQEIKECLLLEHGDKMQENLSEYELCTDAEFNCFMCREGSEYMQYFACDEAIAVLVDAYNVIKCGKPIHCKIAE